MLLNTNFQSRLLPDRTGIHYIDSYSSRCNYISHITQLHKMDYNLILNFSDILLFLPFSCVNLNSVYKFQNCLFQERQDKMQETLSNGLLLDLRRKLCYYNQPDFLSQQFKQAGLTSKEIFPCTWSAVPILLTEEFHLLEG